MLSPTAVPSHPNAPGDLGDHNLPPAHSSSAPEYFLHATQRLNERSRWAMVWMVGFAMLVIATVVALAWYLDHFEQEEELRRRGADAQWLEQSVLFHFRRLEDDVARLSQQAALGHAPTLAQPGKGLHDPQPNGLLWRTPGTILTHTWLTAHAGHNADLPLWREHLQAHPSNRQALNTLLDITTGLRRSSYAGPMRDASGIPGDTLWLAVPYFDGSRLLGNYLVAISIQQTLNTLLPPWFSAQQSVRLVVDGLPDTPSLRLTRCPIATTPPSACRVPTCCWKSAPWGRAAPPYPGCFLWWRCCFYWACWPACWRCARTCANAARCSCVCRPKYLYAPPWSNRPAWACGRGICRGGCCM